MKRACEILKIGSQTYYNKLELLYQKSLEFLERHESAVLQHMKFDELWINTDKMVYDLNNFRKKGSGGLLYSTNKDKKKLTTHVIISADVHSRYVFRSDVSYDYDIMLDEIKQDTTKYKEDHLPSFSQKC